MTYAAPDAVPFCQCRANGDLPLLCPTGHLLECHHPLSCTDAACGHMRRYQDSPTPEDTANAEARARTTLAALSDPRCLACSGAGFTETQFTPDIAVPDSFRHIFPDGLTFTAMAVCACVSTAGKSLSYPN